MDNKTKGHLVNLIEEAAEVGQIAAKCLRFGMDSYNPADPNRTPNSELLAKEIGNLRHVANLMERRKEILAKHVRQGEDAKARRLRKYPLYIADKMK